MNSEILQTKTIEKELISSIDSVNIHKGKYHNNEETKVMLEMRWSTIKKFFQKGEKEPLAKFDFIPFDSAYFSKNNNTAFTATWFGHSSTLLEMEGKRILTDPVFSTTVGPLNLVGTKRFHKEIPINTKQLPHLDFIVISHDHYDHLDRKTIKALQHKTDKFVVPSGVAQYLISWDIPIKKIIELDWGNEITIDGILFACTPARHFSGRGVFDRAKTLWCSWVIKGETKSVFFCGDSGYSSDFEKIGQKYGPFDLGLMECGQYNDDWAQIHMNPEESVKASQDLNCENVIPIHWGAFSLSIHAWYDPIDRFVTAAHGTNLNVLHPQIGKTTTISDETSTPQWWEKYKNSILP